MPKSDASVIDLTVEDSLSVTSAPTAFTKNTSSPDPSDVAILRTLQDNGHTDPLLPLVPINSSPVPAPRRRKQPAAANLTAVEDVSVLKTVKLPRKVGAKPKEILVIPSEPALTPAPLINADSSPTPTLTASKRCPICFDNLQNPSVTLCGHVYCTECITMATRSTKQCPICRKKLTVKGFHPLFL